jgi:hypothetical protein
VHLRRALLLFAIVLGLAALAAALSRPADRAEQRTEPTVAEPAPETGGSLEPAELQFRASHPRRRSLAADQAAQVLVIVDVPGTVDIPGLGLSASADAVTPARFDVLEHRPGRYPILFAPAGSAEATDAAPAGMLVITPAATGA